LLADSDAQQHETDLDRLERWLTAAEAVLLSLHSKPHHLTDFEKSLALHKVNCIFVTVRGGRPGGALKIQSGKCGSGHISTGQGENAKIQQVVASSPAGRVRSHSNRWPVARCTLGLGLLNPPFSRGR